MRILISVISIILMTAPLCAADGKRIALVIGNANYANAPLKNPGNDAADIAAALKNIGFDILLHRDADKREMLRAISAFGNKLKTAKVGFFFFAGHGIRVGGTNYLIPVHTAQIENETDVELEGVAAQRILGKMESAGTEVNIIMLDACRDNPFKRSYRSTGRGLARMDAPKGSFIAYATSPGDVAQDGSGRNSPFTKHLLRHIDKPSLKIEDVLKKVRSGVLSDTGERQTPWQSSSLTGDFYFSLKGNVNISETPTPKTDADREIIFWNSVKDSDNKALYRAYLKKYPNGTFAEIAKVKVAHTNPPVNTDPNPNPRELNYPGLQWIQFGGYRWEVLGDGVWEIKKDGTLYATSYGTGSDHVFSLLMDETQGFKDGIVEYDVELLNGWCWTGISMRCSIFKGGQKRYRNGTSDIHSMATNFIPSNSTFNSFIGKRGGWYLAHPEWKKWQTNTAINKQRNQVKVEVTSNRFSIWINGKLVDRFEDGYHKEGVPLLGVAGTSQVRFSNFRLVKLR